MRARNIKPGFFKNDELGELPFEHRIAFIGLWCMADCNGNLECRTKKIKAELFPYDSGLDMNQIIIDLENTGTGSGNSGLISTYEIESKRYINITNFLKHQNPHKKERDAGGKVPINTGILNNQQEIPGISGAGSGISGSDPADILIPDSLNLNPEEKIYKKDSFDFSFNHFDLTTQGEISQSHRDFKEYFSNTHATGVQRFQEAVAQTLSENPSEWPQLKHAIEAYAMIQHNEQTERRYRKALGTFVREGHWRDFVDEEIQKRRPSQKEFNRYMAIGNFDEDL